MPSDLEETLTRELRAVADGVAVPSLPALPREPAAPSRHWLPLLAAAAVVVLLVAASVLAVATRGGETPEPAPSPSAPTPSEPTGTPDPTQPAGTLPTTPPTVPVVVDQQLHVGGEQVAGSWSQVYAAGDAWVAITTDGTWWWGRGDRAEELGVQPVQSPVLSPDGGYVGELVDDGDGLLTGFDTGSSGEGLGGTPVDLVERNGSPLAVRAVTDDGRVVVQGYRVALLWLPLVDGSTVDLAATAPGQEVQRATPAGLDVLDRATGEYYLAQVTDAGELVRGASLPAHDDLRVSPGSAWLAYVPPGTLGGEVASFATLEAQTLDGDEAVGLEPPAGWAFRAQGWTWEDDEHLVSPVVDDRGAERLVRCSVALARCALIDVS